MPKATSISGMALLITLLTLPALAQNGQPADPRIPAMLQMLGQTRTPSDAAISPDGTTVAWAVSAGRGSEIHLTDLTATGITEELKEHLVSTGSGTPNCSSASPIWSPDGESLAFLSTCTAEGGTQSQIFLWSRHTGESRQLTHLTGAIDMPMWSPDGKIIAFLFVENATRNAGALAPMKPWNGVYGEDGVEVQRVAAVSVAIGAFDYLSPPSLHIYEYSWSPDSSHIVFVAAPPPGENNWWIAQLYTRDVYPSWLSTGRPCPTDRDCLHLNSILDPQEPGPLHGLQIAVPRFSPDGKQIAFIGGLMSDEASNGGDIYLMPLDGKSAPINITSNRSGSPAYIDWRNDSTLKVAERVNGGTRIFDYDVATRAEFASVLMPESIWANSNFVFSVSFAANNALTFVRSSFDHPPEVFAGPATGLRQLTHLNDAQRPLWGKTQSVEWTSDGLHLQGWLLYPANYDATKHYPLITFVHGGPSNATTPRWPAVAYGGVPFAGLGYFVFFPNPRGSFGQGERFTQANVKDFGYGDLRDILTGVDAVEKLAPIDKSREGITGWSYGGYMTMFAVTQTTRFRAAVAGAGISNYQSYYGQNSIDQWLVPFFGKSVYDDPAIYARSSPITFIKQAKTPTLVVVGDRDGECPAPQSFEFWHALREQGVRTQLVIYPNEGHSFQQPAHREDVLSRALHWFQAAMPDH